MAKMDRESFEIYAIESGYILKEVYEGESDNKNTVLVMDKWDGFNTSSQKYLYHTSNDVRFKYGILFESWNRDELLKFYKELKTLSFKVDSSSVDKKGNFQIIYKRGVSEFFDVIFIKKDLKKFRVDYTFFN